MRAIVDVSGLVKLFGELAAVDDVSFNIRPGEVYGLLGPNGAGETTTLRWLLHAPLREAHMRAHACMTR